MTKGYPNSPEGFKTVAVNLAYLIIGLYLITVEGEPLHLTASWKKGT